MRRFVRWFVSALVLAGCSGSGHRLASSMVDAGATCVDLDHDGYGQNCPMGRDCNDSDSQVTNQCRECAHPEVGCSCEPGQRPISCFGPDQVLEGGNVMCREGTRYCRGGAWSGCEAIHDYVVIPDRSLSALVNPDAAPKDCGSPCDVKCFQVTDLLDGGPGSGVNFLAGGGIKLAPTDGGGTMMGGGDGGTGGLSGCAGLNICCGIVADAGVAKATGDCQAALASAMGNNAECNSALQVYCPNVISGPINGCTIGGSALDSDCDGIPDVLDECTPATVATNPACNGSTLPLSTTNNQTIFHILGKGEHGSNSLEIGFKVQNADIYLLMDMTGTMDAVSQKLKPAMKTGNFVECALLKNCCDRITVPATQSACNSVVTTDNQANCKTAEGTYCTGGLAQLTHCPDLDFDGQPDDHLKNEGVVGAVRCMVGTSWFGTGYFREIPLLSGGDTDEQPFRHVVDMGEDTTRVQDAIGNYFANSNPDYPEADMVGLYSLLSGKGQMFGNTSVSIPERLGLGCPANTFGYPCFRKGTIPIVVLFTDDIMHNAPPNNANAYAANYNLNGKAPSSGYARYTPVQAESFATAYNLGDIRNQFVIASGDLSYMAGNYPAAITGCGAETAAPDAVYRFTVSPLLSALGVPLPTPITVKIAMNVNRMSGNYTNYGGFVNGPTPATNAPVVLSLYRGVPAVVQAPINNGDTRINPIPSGPDLTYLTYLGTSAGQKSATGFLGGISGCSADGKTNEVVYTFRPTVDAKIVIDSSQSGFNSTVSLHKGLPGSLPANPTGANQVALIGATGNNNDTFSTARRVDGADAKIDGDYVSYIGDMVALQKTGTGMVYNTPGGKTGLDDYDDSLVSCGVNSAGADAVYRFDVQTARRVRIDTEGSNFKTAISLHDALPPQTFIESPVTGNVDVGTSKVVGTMSGNSVTNAFYAERSDNSGTSSSMDKVAPVCGATTTTGSNDAFYSFHLSAPTHLNLAAPGRTGTATAGEAYNTPGLTNESVTANPPPSAPPASPIINEFVFDHVGADTKEFVEVYGQPNTNYATYTILQIEGDVESNLGSVSKVIAVGTTDSSGLWLSPFYSGALQNGTSTLLLVKNYTGNTSTDIDADNDGVIDVDSQAMPALPPWTAVVDAVAVNDGSNGADKTYGGAPVLGPLGGASRIPSGKDTDSASDWVVNDFDGDGLPGFGFDPIVFLYSSPPGSVTTRDATGNTHNNAATALNLGDVFGQVDTRVTNANLVTATNDYPKGVVACNTFSGLEPPGAPDQAYKFTPTADGTVRIDVATGGAAYHAVAIYDGPPPSSGAIGVTQVFDTSLTSQTGSPPEPGGCTAYSFDSNKADGISAHLYWFCNSARSWATAEANCNTYGGHLVRVDDTNENVFIGGKRTSTPTWIGGHDTSTNVWSWSDNNDQFWSGGKTGSPFGGRFASFSPGTQPATSGTTQCVAYKTSSGANVNNWDSTACTGTSQYVCEKVAPSPTPPESLATAYPIGVAGNLSGKVVAYAGSTRRMDTDINLGTMSPPMSACGASQGAADAVFKITPSVDVRATIDTSGSAFPAIVGLFHTTIDATGYMGCDAPGVAPNRDVTSGATPASTLPLGGGTTCGSAADSDSVTLLAGQTYYAVIKGTSASPDGAYQIKFSDICAGGNGALLACSMETASAPYAAQATADFVANHTYYVIVESNSNVGNAYSMTAHSLYRARTQVENSLDQNEHGGTAMSIADPYRAKDSVVNTSTAGMVANYKILADGGQLTCGASSASPDAVYKFTPSIGTSVRVNVAMPGKTPVVALFKGQPGSYPTVTDLAALGNVNEATSSAYQVNLTGPAQTLTGNTSNMGSDVDGTLLSCGAAAHGRDAVFKFTLAKQTQMQIDASASLGGGMIGDPVISLFHDFALEKPTPVTLENDSYTDANLHPAPTPAVTNNWLVYGADMANMTPATQGQLSVAATNTNEQVNPATLTGAQDLGDVWNTKITVGGATSAAMTADYFASDIAGPWCGGNDNAPDAIYVFHSSQAGDVRITTAKPAPGFNTVLALFDGATGAPARKIDSATTTVSLNSAMPTCGDGLVDWNEECDDDNVVSGDGCDSTCHRENNLWRCAPASYGSGDGCDCGCGIPDPDCGGSTNKANCLTCPPPFAGGCDVNGFCLLIDPANTTRCLPPVCGNSAIEPGEQCDDGNTTSGDGCDSTCQWQAGHWNCTSGGLRGMGDGCDCGCGLPDPDCGTTNATSCVRCNDAGACSAGTCPASINPTNNAICTTFGGGANRNDRPAIAQSVNLAAGGTREFQGNTSAMAHDIDATQIQCGALTTAPDSVFQFTLRKSTQVQIDATGSGNAPVLALFDSAALGVKPALQALAPDSPAEADLNPSPTPQIKGSWVRYSGDTANLTVSSQPQTQINNQDNANNDTPTELPDPINRRNTITNASTSAASMQATFPAPTCGGADTSNDALYRFVPSVDGQVRISTKYPQTGINPVIALYDGTNGRPPLTRAQDTSVTTALGTSKINESLPTAQRVPIEGGATYYQTGDTTGMTSDVPAAYIQQGGALCGAAASSADAVWSFSLSKATDVEISAQGSAYSTVLGLFDSPFIRPSVTQQTSLADSITQLYDIDKLPSEPEAGCTPYDWNLHRYWFCTQKRPWDDARAKCQYAGHDLIVIDSQAENDEMLAQIGSTAESYLIGLRERTPYTGWGAPKGVWVDGSAPYVNGATTGNWYANEPNQPTDSTVARIRSQDGQWVDVPETWQSYRYICEQNNPPAATTPPTSTNPQLVDLFGATRHFVGATTGTPSSVGNVIACGATASAPDAVFRFDVAYTTTVTVDFSTSFAGSVIGLFKGSIGAQGYMDAGSKCALVAAAAPQLNLVNLAAGTYYVVLTGTSAAAAGKYDIVLSATTTDPAAFVMENDKLVDATNNPIGNITNRWVVKTADMAHLTTDLITSRIVDLPGIDTNSRHTAPYQVKDLGVTTGEQVTVTGANTADLTSDYPAPSCGVSDTTKDAIYKFKTTSGAPVRISVAPVGWNAVVALYSGPNLPRLQSQASTMPVTVPNTNEAPDGSAKDVGTPAAPISYLGNVGMMMNNVPTVDAAGRTWDRSDGNGGDASNACNAAPTGKDAFFKFTATANQQVVLDSTGTKFAHTLAVWRSTDPITAPAPRSAALSQYDTRSAAPNLPMDNQWYVLQGTTAGMVPGGDVPVTKVITNNDAVQDLGTLADSPVHNQFVTSGADTSAAAVHSDFDNATLTCGAAPSANDMIFKFHTSAAGGATQIAINNPAPAFPAVLALFDGTGGKTPQTAAAFNPMPTATGNGNYSRANPDNSYAVGSMAAGAVAYSGDTSMLASDTQPGSLYNPATIFGGAACSAGSGSNDAFFKIHLAADTRLRIQDKTPDTTYPHTVAIYDAAIPISQPASATAVQNNTFASLPASPPVIDKQWLYYSTNMTPGTMDIGELALVGATAHETFFTAGTDFQNATGVQDLNAIGGTISAHQFRTKASGSYAGGADTTFSGATYPAPSCGGVSSANDMIFKVRPTTNTKLRVGVDNPALPGGMNPMIAVYDGAPLTSSEIGGATVNLGLSGNTNDLFSSAAPALVGSSTLYIGDSNAAAVHNDYASTQFQAFALGAAPSCSPSSAANANDVFLKLDVRTLPTAVTQYAQLWLDGADDTMFLPAATGAVTTWTDKGPNAHNTSQSTAANRPSRQLVGGSYAVEFNPSGDTSVADDATEDYLDYAYGSGQDSPVSVFAVWKLISTSFTAASAILRTDVGGPPGFGLRMSADGSTNTAALIYRDSSNIDVAMTGALTGATGPMLSEVTHDASGAIATYLNGGSTPFASGTGRVGGTQYQHFLIGANNNHTRGLPMDLYELIVVGRTVSLTERQVIEGYLANKWGLTASLPAGHPYKSSAPTRGVEISSASTGFASTLSFFSAAPMSRPTPATADTPHDTSALALASPVVPAVNSSWFVRSASTAGLHNDDLPQSTATPGGDGVTAAALGAVNGHEVSVSGGSTSSYAGDYPQLSCGTTSAAPDAIYTFTPSGTTQVHIALKNPAFNGDIALFEAPSSAPSAGPISNAQYGLAAAASALGVTNESVSSSQLVPSLYPITPSGGYTGYALGYTGDPAASNVAGQAFDVPSAPGSCHPDLTSNGQDAFFKFTVPAGAPREIEINASGTNGDHVLALFDQDPGSPPKPEVTAGTFASNIDTTPATFFNGAGVWTCSTSGATTAVYSGSDANGTGASITGTSCGTNLFAIMAQTTGGAKVMVVKLAGLTVSNGHTITVRGNLPVIFAVNSNVTLGGGSGTTTITADSQGNGSSVLGAGASYPGVACGGSEGISGVTSAANDDKGGGGGGGGAFKTAGNAGGAGDNAGGAGGGASTADTSTSAATLKPLRGGCEGGNGTSASSGGAGGGAFQISSAGTLTLNTGIVLSASGGAGQRGSAQEDGGGGGGSGGAILVEGATVVENVTFASVAYTNGGGGASGNQTDATNGSTGQDGQRSTVQANGGSGSGGAGPGGKGGASAGTATAGSAGSTGFAPSNVSATYMDFSASTSWTCTASTTLSANINNSTTSVGVASGATFGAAPFSIIVDSEIMGVTAVAGNTLTVTRAQQSTSAASHSSGAVVGGVTIIDSTGGTSACVAITGDKCGGTATLDCVNSVTQTNAGGPTVMIVRASALTVSNAHMIKLTGDKPIVFLVNGNASITGTGVIDASANSTTSSGPGGDLSCGASQGGNNTALGGCGNLDGWGGAGGGGFGTAGGTGGIGNTDFLGNGPHNEPGSTAGTTRGNSTLTPLVGGCRGGNGDSGVAGGRGGGAFQLSASGVLTVTGTVRSNGGKGSDGCGSEGSGAGGGSGGGILLEAATTSVTGTVQANGAGGGKSAWDNNSPGAGSTSAGNAGSTGSSDWGGGTGGGGGYGRLYTGTGGVKRGAGGGGGGGGRGYSVKNVISTLAISEADTAAQALSGSSPGPFSAPDNTWTVKIADLTKSTLQADWAVARTVADAANPVGDTGLNPIDLGDATNARITSNGTTAGRNVDHNEVCGVDGGADTVYKFTPTVTGKVRVKVTASGGTPISNPIVAVYDYAYATGGAFHNCNSALRTCVTDNNSANQAAGQEAQNLSDSDATAGSVTVNDIDVTAAHTYYVVVKSGGGAIVNGAYTFELTWRDPEDWAGCSEDLYDGKDIWFAFTTASTKQFAIDTQDSTAATAIALYADTNMDNAYASSERISCADPSSGFATITATLTAGTKYYVRVKQPTGGSSVGTVVLGVRDTVGVVNITPVALACSDGTNAAGGYAKIVRTLDPGDYYVGWKGGSSSSTYTGAYQVNFRDNANIPAHASEVACASASSGGTADIDATLQAGRTYNLIVKGHASGNSGSYTLNVKDEGAVPPMTCAGKNADPVAPDAFEAFSVSGSPKDVTVDLVGSTLDSVFELWQHPSSGPDVKIGCAATSGTSTAVTSQLAPGNYYVKLRGTNGDGTAGEQPFTISMRDDDVQRASACGDGAVTTGATLTQTLAAGTYYVGLKPQSGASPGPYQLSVRDTGLNQTGGTSVACTTNNTVDVNVTSGHDYYVLVKGETAADKGTFGLTVTDIGALGGLDSQPALYDKRTDIGCGDLAAPDAYYGFQVSSTGSSSQKNVEIKLTNAFNGAFQLYRDDGTFTNDDNIGSCYSGVGATHSYALGVGKYFLVVKGTSVASAAAEQQIQVSIRDLDAMGSIACADGTAGVPAVLQSTSMPASVLNSGKLKAGDYYVAASGQTGQNGPYALMFIDIDQNAGVAAPVVDCTTSQTMTHTLTGNTDYYAIVKGDGPPNQGTYTLSVTDVSNVEAIDSACFTDLGAPDGYAAFTLSAARAVRIDMSGSTLTGAFQLRNSSDGSAVSGCGCSAISSPLTCSLAAGTYYVVYRGNVVAGGLGQQPFKLVLQDLSSLGSLACADGAADSGTVLTTQVLSAGTYYAGIVPKAGNASTDFNYQLSIKDSTSVAVTTAPEIACGSQIETHVNGGQDYYIVVKGKNVGDQGDYSLTVQDLSGVPSFGCNDDSASGDAFYSFTVTNPLGSNVTIDSEGSAQQTVLALFPSTANFGIDYRNNTTRVCCSPVSAGAPTGACNSVASCDGKPDDMVRCDSNSGVSGTSLISGVHLAPGSYYVVVRGRLGAPMTKLPFVVSVRDDDGVPSSYCSAATNLTTGQARIRQTLQPGTYYAALKGSSAASPTEGAYSLRFRDYGPFAKAAPQIACDASSDTIYQNVTAGTPYYVVVKGETVAQQGPYKLTVENFQNAGGMGCGADPQSPDAFYKFSLLAPTRVSIDTQGSTLDTVIAIYNEGAGYFGTNYAQDDAGHPVLCNDDAQGAPANEHWSKISLPIGAKLPAGNYYLEVKGKTGAGAAWGASSEPFVVSIRDEAASSNIACAPATAPTLTFGASNPLPAGDYKLVVSDDGAGGAYDVKFKDLSAVNNVATRVACNTDDDTITWNIPPGKVNNPYYVIVKGDGSPAAKGAYTLSVESVDSGATSMGCGADKTAADAFFKFKVTQQTDVTVDTIGSQLDTVLALYPDTATVFGSNYAKDASGQVIGCDNDGGGGTASKISATLAPGDYYAVVKGKTSGWGVSNQTFNLSVRDDGATRSIACANAGSGGVITQTLDAGSYVAVLSDTTPIAVSPTSGGAYSITFKDMSLSAQENGTEVPMGCALGTLDNGGNGFPVTAGQDYYVVVKGNSASDFGNYTLTVDDVISTGAAAGSTPIACAAVTNSIDAVYPPGDYYAVVTGANGANGAYELDVKDADPFLDYNRLACDKDSGPNGTSAIEADLQPGPYYVVVKGDGPTQVGTYQLNVRDVTANPDNRIACAESSASASNKITADVKAGQDYTVLLKGDEKFAQGNYNLELYDVLGLQSNGGGLKGCETICPDIAPYNNNASGSKCAAAQLGAANSVLLNGAAQTWSLPPDTYYLTVKGRKATEKAQFELQIGDTGSVTGTDITAKGTTPKYVPPTWGEVNALLQPQAAGGTGVKVLPVLSCSGGGMCASATTQAKTIAQTSGAIDKQTGQGLVQFINPDGSGIGSKLTMAVRDLANYLAMDITLATVPSQPFGFLVDIQKCTNPLDLPAQASCTSFSTGCSDANAVKNTITACQPGAAPKFFVQFTNPPDPNAVPPNPNDPNGGYHFKLQIVGNHQYLLDEIPVYIIPTDKMGPPPPTPGAGSYQTTGTYEQQVFGSGCNYYQVEGGANHTPCTVGSTDPGCQAGSCLDGIDNDGDMKSDAKDPDCATTDVQDWTDLFFSADIPTGTSIVFDMCTGDTLDMMGAIVGCSFSRLATVVSGGGCATNAECKGVNIGGVLTDGFCGTGGQCQFIQPPKLSGFCTSDSDCPNAVHQTPVITKCNTSVNQCQYASPPADVGNHLMQGQNGKPYAKLRITLKSDAAMSQTPTLYEWHMQYVCRTQN